MTVITLSHTLNAGSGSQKTAAGREKPARLVVDAHIVLSRIRHSQRLRRERALRLSPAAHQYTPRMDLYDDKISANVAAMLELPGIDRSSLSLSIEGTKLCVHGERGSPLAARMQQATSTQPDTPFPAHSYKVRELKFGSFHREIDIPAGTETSDIAAEMTDGMLLISWPRDRAGASLSESCSA